MANRSSVLILETAAQVAHAAAERFVTYAEESIRDHGSFTVALAGGNTPRLTYESLATNEFSRRIAWPRVQIFFGDERAVPPQNPDSNYRMVHEALISRVAIPPANVHRVQGELDANESASAYETELRTVFGAVEWPRFDLVLLGMGADGHTASLFPDSPALTESTKWVIATLQPQTRQQRITLTLPVLNHSVRVLFLVTGKEKAAAVARVLNEQTARAELPAQKVRPANAVVEWLIDKAGAANLSSAHSPAAKTQ